MFAPGGDLAGAPGLSRAESNHVYVKSENFQREDIAKLLQMSITAGRAQRDLSALLDNEHLEALLAHEDGSFEAAADFIASDSSYANALLDGEEERRTDPNYPGIASVKLSRLREAVQKTMLNSYLHSQGKAVFTGGDRESSGDKPVQELASTLHISIGLSDGSAEDSAEEVPNASRTIEYFGAKRTLDMDPRARRVLFASGVRSIKHNTPTVGKLAQQNSGHTDDY